MNVLYLIDHKESSGDHRSPNGGRRIELPSPSLGRTQVFPFEHQIPVESAPEVDFCDHRSGGICQESLPEVCRGADVVECVEANDVDDGTHHSGRILGHSFEHRLLQKRAPIFP